MPKKRTTKSSPVPRRRYPRKELVLENPRGPGSWTPYCLYDTGFLQRGETNFFQFPIGMQDRDETITNMQLEAMLPRAQRFRILEMCWTGASIATEGVLRLDIGSRHYYTAPLAFGSVRLWQNLLEAVTIEEMQMFRVAVRRNDAAIIQLRVGLNGLLWRPDQ